MPRPEQIAPDQIQMLKQRLDLREIAAQYTTLRGGREQVGPCPRCGGVDRFHCQADRYFCRQCQPPETGKGRHDVFSFAEFVGLAHGFREAYAVACGWANTMTVASPCHPTPTISKAPAPPDWSMRIDQEMERCAQRLASPQGQLGRAYLAQRRITPETIRTAHLGLAWRMDATGHKGWAIALPWMYADLITAIQYRFIEPQAQRYTRFSYAKYRGETILYTLTRKDTDTVIITEGEFNALALWQATPYDAVSFGSENMTMKTRTALQQVGQTYPQCMIWADKPAVAQTIADTIDRPACLITSHQDANEWLQQGQLSAFIARQK